MLRDTWLVFARALRQTLRNPAWVVVGLTQPVLYLALFGPLLERVAATPGFVGGNAWNTFVPALLVQQALFGSAFVGFGLISDYRSGLVERLRVTPASRAALLLGRTLRDVLVLLVQCVVLLVVGTAFGLRPSPGAVLAGLLLVALLGGAITCTSYALALRVKTEDVFAPMLNTLILPLFLLSGVLLPMSLAPTWLRVVSDVNPLKHVVEAERSVFLDDYFSGKVLVGLAVALVLLVLGATWGTRTFRRENA
ncbi:MAG TPA: ABC transporter permease [Pseudonocardiaceae bacterium]